MPEETKPIRAFIAVAVPEEIRQGIATFQRQWRNGLSGNFIRWTPVAQMHLTLRFLGSVRAEAVPELAAALRRACAGVTAFELSVGGSGCFPDARKPRVLWVGVGGALTALAELQARVVGETAPWGEVEEREFHAHLTLGRVKNAPPALAGEIAKRAQTLRCGELGRWRVGEVWLLRSELAPSGATHTELARVALGNQ
jgi:2'-5' RNA ligase